MICTFSELGLVGYDNGRFLQLTAMFATLDSLFIMLLSNWFEKIMWTKYKFTVHNMCVCIKIRTAPLAICQQIYRHVDVDMKKETFNIILRQTA